jgi:hypothetical protein
MTLLDKIHQKAKTLQSEVVETDDGHVFKSTGLSVLICTNSAKMFQEEFGGRVVGYYAEDNPEATMGADEGGHDFLVLGDLLIDWWGYDVYGTPLVLDINDPRVSQMYGKRELWKEVPVGHEQAAKS